MNGFPPDPIFLLCLSQFVKKLCDLPKLDNEDAMIGAHWKTSHRRNFAAFYFILIMRGALSGFRPKCYSWGNDQSATTVSHRQVPTILVKICRYVEVPNFEADGG